MSGAYIEMLPPDRPVHMLGQPIIKLVASGGPGGDLGDLGRRGWRRRRPRGWGAPPPVYGPGPYYAPLPPPPPVQVVPVMPIVQDDSAFDSSGSMPTVTDVTMGQHVTMGQYNAALQQELTAVAEGAAPDVSAEYFRPKDIPGLPSASEGPHTGREGIYPKKLRDMVVYDMSGSSGFVSLADIAAATPMPNFGGSLGCCGADGMGDTFGMPLGQYGMPLGEDAAVDANAAETAKLLKGRCDGIEAKAKEIVAAVVKANSDSSLTAEQRHVVAKAAKTSLKALKRDWRGCRKAIKKIIHHFKRKGNLKDVGLSGLADKVETEEKLARCRAKLRSIREIACKKKA